MAVGSSVSLERWQHALELIRQIEEEEDRSRRFVGAPAVAGAAPGSEDCEPEMRRIPRAIQEEQPCMT